MCFPSTPLNTNLAAVFFFHAAKSNTWYWNSIYSSVLCEATFRNVLLLSKRRGQAQAWLCVGFVHRVGNQTGFKGQGLKYRSQTETEVKIELVVFRAHFVGMEAWGNKSRVALLVLSWQMVVLTGLTSRSIFPFISPPSCFPLEWVPQHIKYIPN